MLLFIILLQIVCILGKSNLKANLTPCRAYKQCYKCLKEPSCGWCENECMEGTEEGPTNTKCKNTWSYKACSQELCGLYVDCLSCLQNPYCGYCGSQRTCVNGNAIGPDRKYFSLYFKNNIDSIFNECKANWAYKTFIQNCYFKVKEADRISKKYDGYYDLFKKYLNEARQLKDMKKKLKIKKENDFSTQIVLTNVQQVDLKKALTIKKRNILDIYKQDLGSKEIRIDKPSFKKFNQFAYKNDINNQNFTIKIEGNKVINVSKIKEENEYLKLD